MTEQQIQAIRSDIQFFGCFNLFFIFVLAALANCRLDFIEKKIDEIHHQTVPEEKSPEQLKIETLEQELEKLKKSE